MGRTGHKGASFDPDDAEITPGPPLFFERLRAPCACGRTFAPTRYTFFSSTLYMEGDCKTCGRVLAIFAPPVECVQLPTPLTPSEQATVDDLYALLHAPAPPDSDDSTVAAPPIGAGIGIEHACGIVQSPTRRAG